MVKQDFVMSKPTTLPPVPSLGKDWNQSKENPEADECIGWLVEQRFNLNARNYYCPDDNVVFAVLCPLEDLGDDVLPIGTWKRVYWMEILWPDPQGRSIFAKFENVMTGVQRFYYVGYHSRGVHAIMAWKDNILLVSPAS